MDHHPSKLVSNFIPVFPRVFPPYLYGTLLNQQKSENVQCAGKVWPSPKPPRGRAEFRTRTPLRSAHTTEDLITLYGPFDDRSSEPEASLHTCPAHKSST